MTYTDQVLEKYASFWDKHKTTLLAGGAGALLGGLGGFTAAGTDPEDTPGLKFMKRLRTAAVGGLLGGTSAAGAAHLAKKLGIIDAAKAVKNKAVNKFNELKLDNAGAGNLQGDTASKDTAESNDTSVSNDTSESKDTPAASTAAPESSPAKDTAHAKDTAPKSNTVETGKTDDQDEFVNPGLFGAVGNAIVDTINSPDAMKYGGTGGSLAGAWWGGKLKLKSLAREAENKANLFKTENTSLSLFGTELKKAFDGDPKNLGIMLQKALDKFNFAADRVNDVLGKLIDVDKPIERALRNLAKIPLVRKDVLSKLNKVLSRLQDIKKKDTEHRLLLQGDNQTRTKHKNAKDAVAKALQSLNNAEDTLNKTDPNDKKAYKKAINSRDRAKATLAKALQVEATALKDYRAANKAYVDLLSLYPELGDPNKLAELRKSYVEFNRLLTPNGALDKASLRADKRIAAHNANVRWEKAMLNNDLYNAQGDLQTAASDLSRAQLISKQLGANGAVTPANLANSPKLLQDVDAFTKLMSDSGEPIGAVELLRRWNAAKDARNMAEYNKLHPVKATAAGAARGAAAGGVAGAIAVPFIPSLLAGGINTFFPSGDVNED